jgi:RHS repeat-associated protein
MSHSVNYASTITYDPTGPIASLTLGNGVAEAWTFGTPLKQPTQLTATGGPGSINTKWTWGYGATSSDNGNVMSAGVVIAAGGVNASQSFGEGRRVMKATGSVSTTYVYDAGGQLAAEYTNEAVPATGTEYLTDDHLGSTRLVTGPSGNIVRRYDFLPFGEDLTAGTDGRSASTYNSALPVGPTQDWVNNKFTGKLRDNETGLDWFGARYFSGAQGRFTTPDWSAKPQPVPYADLTDPQTLNLYGYVRNNPLNKDDPDGHWDPGQTVSDAWETGTGYVRGAAASLSYGLVGGPKSTDSPQSRVGQALGTSAVGIEGIKHMVAGGTKATIAMAAAPETGVSALAVPGAVVEAVAGAVVTVGAVKNAVALASTPMESRSNPLSGQPGSTSTTTQPSGDPKQVRRYGQDGHAETDVDYGHDHGQGDPHAHDWGRPADGGAPTHTDRAPGRPVKPGDPQP